MKKFEKISFLPLPTPVHRMHNIEKLLGFSPIFVKRDDLLGRGLGGVKLRKLEYILRSALDNKADTLVTVGALNSNHCFYTALIAKMYGLKCILFLVKPVSKKDENNLFLNDIFSKNLGAEIYEIEEIPDEKIGKGFGIVSESTEREVWIKCKEVIEKLQKNGYNPFYIPPGSVTPIGCYAMIEAFEELYIQMHSLGINSYDIFVPVGTGGVFCGLWFASQLRAKDVKIYGISIGANDFLCNEIVKNACQQLCKKIEHTLFIPAKFDIFDEFKGEGYGIETHLSQQAIKIAFEEEGLFLDHTYSGKCFAGMLEMIRKKRGIFTKPIVFWHSGGVVERMGNIINTCL
ncbi:MAG: pyridoxal-phosphate dependent enzyme [Candidatus Omnitrophica bacterium]|nr:pyridoxal-phosphate dependent enzyme [Candidatus Omnitrophota bacterium]